MTMLLVVRSRHRYPLWLAEYLRKTHLADRGCHFVSGFGGEIRIAGATKHAQVHIGGGNSMKGDVWTGRADCLGGEVVQ
jgi:hypothetical protein